MGGRARAPAHRLREVRSAWGPERAHSGCAEPCVHGVVGGHARKQKGVVGSPRPFCHSEAQGDCDRDLATLARPTQPLGNRAWNSCWEEGGGRGASRDSRVSAVSRPLAISMENSCCDLTRGGNDPRTLSCTSLVKGAHSFINPVSIKVTRPLGVWGLGGGGGCGWRGHKDDCPGGAQSLMRVFSPLPAGKAGLSALRGLSSAMGVGVSLLLQFSLTSGGYQSVGGSRRYSRRSIPRNIPRRSWKKPHLQLHGLQGRVWPSLLGSQTIPQPQC